MCRNLKSRCTQGTLRDQTTVPVGPYRRVGAHAGRRTAEIRVPRYRDRPARQSVLFYRHFGVHSGAQNMQESGRYAVHQRRRAFENCKRQNQRLPEPIKKIIDAYNSRKEEAHYARRVSLAAVYLERLAA